MEARTLDPSLSLRACPALDVGVTIEIPWLRVIPDACWYCQLRLDTTSLFPPFLHKQESRTLVIVDHRPLLPVSTRTSFAGVDLCLGGVSYNYQHTPGIPAQDGRVRGNERAPRSVLGCPFARALHCLPAHNELLNCILATTLRHPSPRIKSYPRLRSGIQDWWDTAIGRAWG